MLAPMAASGAIAYARFTGRLSLEAFRGFW